MLRRFITVSVFAGLFFAVAATAGEHPHIAAQPASAHTARPYCHHRLFTVKMAERAADAIYSGYRHVTASNLRLLTHIKACERNPQAKQFVYRYYQRDRAAWKAHVYDHQHPFHDATASVYDAAGGSIACSGMSSYDMGVANLSLPCGTKLDICYSRCVEAVVFDRGPYVGGRDFDLSRAVEQASGFPDSAGVATIRYRIR